MKVATASEKKSKGKKKPKPNTLTNYFQTRKNSQGFDIHLCRYEKKMEDYVYLPKNYGHRAKPWRDCSFCCSCKLQPCIAIEYWDEIFEKAYEEYKKMEAAKRDGSLGKKICPVAVMDRIAKFAMKYYRKHRGSNYVKMTGMPECIIKSSNEYNLTWWNCE